MQKGSCEKFLKLPQNHRFDEFSIFMNFIRGANTHISVAKRLSAGMHPHVAPSRGTFTWHPHVAPS